jgi:hypothetical protein
MILSYAVFLRGWIFFLKLKKVLLTGIGIKTKKKSRQQTKSEHGALSTELPGDLINLPPERDSNPRPPECDSKYR